jgi:DNA-binding response OmpR family regulator
VKLERILIVHDNPPRSSDEASVLKNAGYDVVTANSLLEGMSKLYETRPELVVLAQDLGKNDSHNPYLRVRRLSYTPIIVVGEKEKASETLELGADAYIPSPVKPSELLARVNSILRRKRKMLRKEPPGNDGKSHSDSTSLPGGLTDTEFRIARCLELNAGEVLKNSEIIDEVWSGQKRTPRTLHFHIRKLKSKLDNLSIFQLRGTGYYMLRSE